VLIVVRILLSDYCRLVDGTLTRLEFVEREVNSDKTIVYYVHFRGIVSF
jgi:hypothetical protein